MSEQIQEKPKIALKPVLAKPSITLNKDYQVKLSIMNAKERAKLASESQSKPIEYDDEDQSEPIDFNDDHDSHGIKKFRGMEDALEKAKKRAQEARDRAKGRYGTNADSSNLTEINNKTFEELKSLYQKLNKNTASRKIKTDNEKIANMSDQEKVSYFKVRMRFVKRDMAMKEQREKRKVICEKSQEERKEDNEFELDDDASENGEDNKKQPFSWPKRAPFDENDDRNRINNAKFNGITDLDIDNIQKEIHYEVLKGIRTMIKKIFGQNE